MRRRSDSSDQTKAVNNGKIIHKSVYEARTMRLGPLGDGIIYILALIWSRDSQVPKSPPHRKSLKYSHTRTRKHTDALRESSHNTALVVCLVCLQVSVCGVRVCVNSVTHLLGYFVWVENARHGHLQFVFLLLGLTQRGFPLLQEQIGGVLTRKFLKGTQRKREHANRCVPPASCHLCHNPLLYNFLFTHTHRTPGNPRGYTTLQDH